MVSSSQFLARFVKRPLLKISMREVALFVEGPPRGSMPLLVILNVVVTAMLPVLLLQSGPEPCWCRQLRGSPQERYQSVKMLLSVTVLVLCAPEWNCVCILPHNCPAHLPQTFHHTGHPSRVCVMIPKVFDEPWNTRGVAAS